MPSNSDTANLAVAALAENDAATAAVHLDELRQQLFGHPTAVNDCLGEAGWFEVLREWSDRTVAETLRAVDNNPKRIRSLRKDLALLLGRTEADERIIAAFRRHAVTVINGRTSYVNPQQRVQRVYKVLCLNVDAQRATFQFKVLRLPIVVTQRIRTMMPSQRPRTKEPYRKTTHRARKPLVQASAA